MVPPHRVHDEEVARQSEDENHSVQEHEKPLVGSREHVRLQHGLVLVLRPAVLVPTLRPVGGARIVSRVRHLRRCCIHCDMVLRWYISQIIFSKRGMFIFCYFIIIWLGMNNNNSIPSLLYPVQNVQNVVRIFVEVFIKNSNKNNSWSTTVFPSKAYFAWEKKISLSHPYWGLQCNI